MNTSNFHDVTAEQWLTLCMAYDPVDLAGGTKVIHIHIGDTRLSVFQPRGFATRKE